MTEPMWHILIVRAWRDGDGFKVRFITQAGELPPSTAVEVSAEAACQRFEAWLRSAQADPATTPAVTPRPPRRRRTRQDDEQETGEQTGAP